MPPEREVNYLKGLFICHGKTELCIGKHICTKLHLNIKPYSKDRGSHSIEITDLNAILNKYPFDTISNFKNAYGVEVMGKGKKQKICNFKLFIIMDLDNLGDKIRKDYISKKMFEEHWLYEYIVPILNVEKIDDVLLQSKVIDKKVKDNEKGHFYETVFPINKAPLCYDTYQEAVTLKERLSKNKNTNMDEFIEYCISNVKSFIK